MQIIYGFMVSSISIRMILNISIWPTEGTLIGTTTSSQSGPSSNGDEGIFHIPYISRIGALWSNVFLTQEISFWGEGGCKSLEGMQSVYSKPTVRKWYTLNCNRPNLYTVQENWVNCGAAVHCTFTFYEEVLVEPDSLPRFVKDLGRFRRSCI